MPVVTVLGLVGIWETSALVLRGSTLTTAAFTAGVALLGAWAIAVLRGE